MPEDSAADEDEPATTDADPSGRRPFVGTGSDGGELIIGLVGAVGSDLDHVQQPVRDAFQMYGYSTEMVRVSEEIEEFFRLNGVASPNADTSLDKLMDQGDLLRSGSSTNAAAAVLAVQKIKRNREKATGDESGEATREFAVTVVRQLKRPEEVHALRTAYGPHFILVGAWTPLIEREGNVERRLRAKHPGKDDDWYHTQVRRILMRDQKDATNDYGQRLRETYELADAYISITQGSDVRQQVLRLVDLIFGAPYETPSRDEQAMFMAMGASYRSSDAGRQVGAVVVDSAGEILVSGTNEVPRAGGGQYWPGDSPDFRDFQIGWDENERQKHHIVTDVLVQLKKANWLREGMDEDPAELAFKAVTDGPLSSNRVGNLLEFARVAHAEMAAICTAARRGTPIGGGTMYTTAYPCHECARLIIASGVRRVVYVDPYPKSQVPAMYQQQVSEGGQGRADAVNFEPFTGIAPRAFADLFQSTNRERDDISGVYSVWDRSTALPTRIKGLVRASLSTYEDAFIEGDGAKLNDVDWADVLSAH